MPDIADPTPIEPLLDELSIDRMAARVSARGRVPPGADVDRITLRCGDWHNAVAPVAGVWSMVLELGAPPAGQPLVELAWSGPRGPSGAWRVPVAVLHDATPFQSNISMASFCRVTGRFECRGWGFPSPGSLTLLINGRAVAHTAKRFVRTDVAQQHPWSRGIATGWSFAGTAGFCITGDVAMEVCSSQGAVRIVLGPAHERFKLLNDRGAANAVRVPIEHALWHTVPSLLRRAPLALHRALLASAGFGALWGGAPGGLAAQCHGAVVDSLVDRNGHWQALRLLEPAFAFNVPREDLLISAPTQLNSVYNRRLNLLHHHDFPRGVSATPCLKRPTRTSPDRMLSTRRCSSAFVPTSNGPGPPWRC